MRMQRNIFILILLTFSLSSFAAYTNEPGKGTGGAQGGAGGAQGGAGGAGGGNGGYGQLPIDELNIVDGGVPQFGVNNVKPVGNGTCSVTGSGVGPWAGSPCEKIYGPTPIHF